MVYALVVVFLLVIGVVFYLRSKKGSGEETEESSAPRQETTSQVHAEELLNINLLVREDPDRDDAQSGQLVYRTVDP